MNYKQALEVLVDICFYFKQGQTFPTVSSLYAKLS